MIFKLCGITTEEDWRRRLPIYKNHVKETFKEFPPSSVALLETLLAIDPAECKTAIAALMSEVIFISLLSSCFLPLDMSISWASSPPVLLPYAVYYYILLIKIVNSTE